MRPTPRVPTMSSGFVLTGPRSLERRSRALPALADDWARVRFLYCGLCGSDVSKFEGRREISYPTSLGHELIAEVVAVGSAVRDLAPGAVVTSDLNYRCLSCDQCNAGRSHLCREGQGARFTNRAFADLGDFHSSYLVSLEGSARPHLALAEPLSCVLHAKAWGAPQPDDRILVLGAGGLGICLAFALCQDALSFEITDPITPRLSLTKEAAAPHGRAVAQPDGEYDLVFDLSGSESGLRAACSHVKPGGRLCSMSHLDGYSSCDFLLGSLTRKDVSFKVSYLNGEPEILRAAANLLERAWTPAWDKLVKIVPLDQLQEAFESRRTAPWCKTVIEIVSAT